MWDVIQKMLMLAYGLTFAGGLLGFIYWRHGWRWRQIQESFPATRKQPLRTWHLQSIYCHSDGLIFSLYRGIVSIGVCEEGLTFSVLPPVSFVQPKFFVPYEDITVCQRDWLLMGRVCELAFRHRPGMKMIIPGRVGDLLLDRGRSLLANVKGPDQHRMSSVL